MRRTDHSDPGLVVALSSGRWQVQAGRTLLVAVAAAAIAFFVWQWLLAPPVSASNPGAPLAATPELVTSSEDTPGEIDLGESFELEISVAEYSGQGDRGGISVSFPGLTNTGGNSSSYDSTQGKVETISYTNGVSMVTYHDQGDQIYKGTDSSTSAADYLLVESDDGDWPSRTGDDYAWRTLKLRVTPKETGEFEVHYRFWLCGDRYQECDRRPRPEHSDQEDQQRWAVNVITVDVTNPVTETGHFARDPDEDFNTLDDAGNDSPEGIWSDGTTMWVADYSDDKIYAYNLSTKARDSDKDFNTLEDAENEGPTGIWSDGTTMWVADSSDDKIYAYNLSTKARDSDKDFNTLEDAENGGPTGIWSDGTTMWVADYSDDKIYAYDMDSKGRVSSKDFNTLEDAENERAEGIWSDGATMWVADYHDDKIYAYNLNTKARVSSKDFDTLEEADNESPAGLWSDRTTVWVADSSDSKIYAYNAPEMAPAPVIANRAPSVSKVTPTSASVSLYVGNSQTFEASANDPDDNLTSWDWSIDGTSENNGRFGFWPFYNSPSGTVTKEFTHTFSSAGTYTVEATFTDKGARSGSVTWTVEVINRAPVISSASPSSSHVLLTMGGSQTFAATVSDADNNLKSWDWSVDGTSEDSGNWGALFSPTPTGPVTKSFSHTFSAVGGYKVRATFADTDGDSDSQEWMVQVVQETGDYERDSDKDFNTLDAAGNGSPAGIWSDGTTMWVADSSDEKIYAYNLSTKARDSAKDFNTLEDAGNDSPEGIWSDETTMWVADSSDEKIYAYNLSTKARDSAKDFNTLDAAGNEGPAGIWSDGTTMWVADSSDEKIYAYNLSTKARDSAKDFNTLEDAGNDSPEGIWSDETTMWVADYSDDKIYAYSLSAKAGDFGKDFNTLDAAGNEGPAGIWSDGTTMWVADYSDDKIYAYDGPGMAGPTQPDPTNSPPAVSKVTPTSVPVSLYVGNSQTFEASASDPDDNLTSWDWSIDGTSEDSGRFGFLPIYNSPTGTVTKEFTHTFASSGTHTVKVVFTDDEGASGSVSWTVEVEAPPTPTENRPPTVSIVSPATSTISLGVGDVQTFDVRGTDPDGNLAKWKWVVDKHDSLFDGHQEPEEIFTATGSITKSFSHTFPDDGTYTVTVTFTDSEGLTGAAEWTVKAFDGSVSLICGVEPIDSSSSALVGGQLVRTFAEFTAREDLTDIYVHFRAFHPVRGLSDEARSDKKDIDKDDIAKLGVKGVFIPGDGFILECTVKDAGLFGVIDPRDKTLASRQSDPFSVGPYSVSTADRDKVRGWLRSCGPLDTLIERGSQVTFTPKITQNNRHRAIDNGHPVFRAHVNVYKDGERVWRFDTGDHQGTADLTQYDLGSKSFTPSEPGGYAYDCVLTSRKWRDNAFVSVVSKLPVCVHDPITLTLCAIVFVHELANLYQYDWSLSSTFCVGGYPDCPFTYDAESNLSPPSVRVGEPVSLSFRTSGLNGVADHGGVTVSFPDLTDVGTTSADYEYVSDKASVSTVSYTTGRSNVTYHRTGASVQTANGTPGTANYLLVESDDSEWPSGADRTLELELTPWEPGTFQVQSRYWLCLAGYDECRRKPESVEPDQPDQPDQQGWQVDVLEITVDAVLDRDELVEFYEDTDGPNWDDDTGWLGHAPLDDWRGVDTGADDRVTVVELPSNSLSGAIPTVVGDLTGLEVLDLSRNGLTGEIPAALESLTALRTLSLSGNGLTGEIPAAIESLIALGTLNLSGNGLTGEIPSDLGDLTALTTLDLSANDLDGGIPSGLGRLIRLEALVLYDNDLNRPIPAELGNLTKLTELDLSDNGLSGSIPAELDKLANLQVLDLSNNDLREAIPEKLGLLAKLVAVYLDGNMLDSGCIPAAWRNLRNHDLGDLGLPFCDVLLSGLTISPGVLTPRFESGRTDYTAEVGVSRITVTPTNSHNATFMFLYENGAPIPDADGTLVGHQVELGNGVTTIGVKVLSQDAGASHTYTIQVSRDGSLPDAPAIVVPITPGAASLMVSWTAPPGETGITSYDLRYIESGSQPDANWTVVESVWTSGSGSPNYRITGLANGTQYDVQVRTVNAAGHGFWSAVATGTPRTTPGSPVIDSLGPGDSTLAVEWSTPATDGGAEVAGYDLRFIPSDAPDKADANWTGRSGIWSSGALRYDLGGLTNGVSYDVLVRAVNAVGHGPWSPAATGTPRTTPGAPVIDSLIPGDGALNVGWSDPATDGGAEVTGYDLRYIRSDAPDRGDANWTVRSIIWSSGPLGYDLGGLTDGVGYDVQVRAANAAGHGQWSGSITATPHTMPTAPAIVSVAAGDAALTISWTAPADTGGLNIQGYDVRYIPAEENSPGATWTKEQDVGTLGSLEHTVTGLTNGVRYDLELRAVTSAGDGPWSSAFSATPKTTPDVPIISLITPDGSTLTVAWDAPANTGGSAVTSYDLRYIESGAIDKADANWTEEVPAWSTGPLSYAFGSLTGGTPYDVQVRAVNAAGPGPWSATFAGTPVTIQASRSFAPEPVSAGGELEVTITAAGYGGFGGVVETLPMGFSYVSSSLSDSAVTVAGQEVSFTLFGDTAFAYTVAAPSAGGTYSFSGVLKNSNAVEQPVGGVSRITVEAGALSVSITRNATTLVRLGTAIPVTATFGAPVSGFTVEDVSVTNGVVSNFAGSRADYTFDVTPNAIGKVTVDIAAGAATDAGGNGNTAASQLSLGIPYDDDGDGAIEKAEVIEAINDYLFGAGDEAISKAEVIELINAYLFG